MTPAEAGPSSRPGVSLSDGYARFVNLDREWKAAFLRVVVVAGLLVGGVPASVSADAGPSAAQARAGEWWLDALGVSKAHGVTQGAGVTVCVIDNVFDVAHPDLAGADVTVAADISQAAPGGFAEFDRSHGTSVVGLLAGQGSGPSRGAGILGVAPKASVRAVKALERGPSVAEGLKACADVGASVISVSIATTVDARALAYAQARDAVVVVGTGNGGSSTSINNLAGQWGVVAVTGVDATLTHDPNASTSMSTFPLRDIDPAPGPEDRGGTAVAGPFSTKVSARGASCVGLPVLKFGGGYEVACGTSLATPVVAGVVALVRSAHPELNAANVVNRLVRTARPMGAASVPSVPLGFGVVDAYAAVSADVPVVEHSPLGSCYTGGRGVWDVRVKPTRAEPPVGSRLAPAPWKDPIADVSAGPRVSASGGSSVGAGVAVGPVSGSGLLGFPVLAWVLLGVVLVVGSLIVAVVSITKRRSPTSR